MIFSKARKERHTPRLSISAPRPQKGVVVICVADYRVSSSALAQFAAAHWGVPAFDSSFFALPPKSPPLPPGENMDAFGFLGPVLPRGGGGGNVAVPASESACAADELAAGTPSRASLSFCLRSLRRLYALRPTRAVETTPRQKTRDIITIATTTAHPGMTCIHSDGVSALSLASLPLMSGAAGELKLSHRLRATSSGDVASSFSCAMITGRLLPWPASESAGLPAEAIARSAIIEGAASGEPEAW